MERKRQFNRQRTVTDSGRDEQGRRKKKEALDDDGDEGEAATGGDGRYSW